MPRDKLNKAPPAKALAFLQSLRLHPVAWLVGILLIVYSGTFVWHVHKPLPDGLDTGYPLRAASDVNFLVDSTWLDADGQQHQRSEIFETLFALIDGAEQLIVLEMFLINEFAGQAGDGHRALSSQVFDRLLARRQARPDMQIVLIVDPFNRLYGGVESARLDALKDAGIDVIETDLTVLRDSNPLWSAAWRMCCQWFDNSPNGWLPNPVGGNPVSLRTWLTLLNFKANHRKALVVDQGGQLRGWVSSGNAHDASSRHSNVALTFSGLAAADLLASMRATATLSGQVPDWPNQWAPPPREPAVSGAAIQVLTEAATRDVALKRIERAESGDRLDVAMFYLSHRALIEALIRAHQRGVELRILLDPNEDAFGRKKNGIPNRQVASELHAAGVPLRWCNTRGEQCHFKYMLHQGSDDQPVWLLLGSANFTRRNLDNYNLETQVALQADSEHPAAQRALAFFEQQWNNNGERFHSLPYGAYADESALHYWRYRLMEASGLSTF
ncbi:phospholipase D-like domain-containing protein [uncultured Porticoccus sp.]|uniref:phospholipase D-like domain-containing protein n=1 Tax=uncultured Porticoccus sp. TaxID=1256050 RepID=UPI00261B5DB9|nr:phospholipase D-like domain-containing protein [uncultured Porticoccus sp.]